MRDARVQQVEHVSDSDSEDRDTDTAHLTIGIFPNHQPPTYLLMPNRQENVHPPQFKYLTKLFLSSITI